MRMRNRFPKVSWDNIHCWGRDDITGLPMMMNESVKQMEYIGGRLAWRGFLTHKDDVDEPNPQLIPPRLKADPVSIKNPRIMKLPRLPLVPTGLRADVITDNSVTVSWDAVAPEVSYYVVLYQNFFFAYDFQQIKSIPTTLTITGLTSGSTYTISVASFLENAGESTFSDPITLTTL